MDAAAGREAVPPKAPLLGRRWFPWAVLGGLALAAFPLAGLVALIVANDQAQSPPSCYGLGFGCVPGPWDTAALLGALFYAPAVLVLAAAVLVTELWGAGLTKARSVLALAGAAVILALALVFVAASFGG